VVLHNSSEGDCAPKIPSRHPMHVELPKTLFMVPHVCFVCDRGEFKHGRGGGGEGGEGGGGEGRQEREGREVVGGKREAESGRVWREGESVRGREGER
jgi:hypothetical protein